MRFDLKTPCKNCPFRNDKTRIVFAARSRAEEIEESAYRHGFPCHRSAELVDDDENDDENGYHAGENSQHCIGYIIMQLKENGNSPWPGIDNDDDLINRIEDRLDDYWNLPVFNSTEEFFEANDPDKTPEKD